jgi:ATP-dependent helicase/nuclease subunit A
VGMTPIAKVLKQLGWRTPSEISVQLLGELHSAGFAGTLACWVDRLDPYLDSADQFSRLRGRQLVEAARKFDETGERSVSGFLDWAECYTMREAVSPGVVRVLTVHKSKGLGFDVVILPDLQGQSIIQRRNGLAVHRDENHEVDWILDLPAKALAESDPVLMEQMGIESADGAYEAFCLLYVALTRAKQALYVVVEPIKKSVSKNFPQLLNAALSDGWSRGDSSWFETRELEDSQVDPRPSYRFSLGQAPARIKRLAARTPSGDSKGQLSGANCFALRSHHDAAAGSRIHEELARIEWLEDMQPERWLQQRLEAGVETETLNILKFCLTGDSLRSVFHRPQGGHEVEVWRERAFEIVLDDDWISGAFDRVVLEKDSTGRIIQAWLFDFKTSVVRDREHAEIVANQYYEQINVYRKVVGALTGLASDSISAEIVFTMIGIRIPIT